MMDGTDLNQCSLVTPVARWAWAVHSGRWTRQGTGSQQGTGARPIGCHLPWTVAYRSFVHSFNRFYQMVDTEIDQTQPCPQ